MTLPRMYTDFAQYWTLISDPADYAQEARYWRDALRAKLGPGRHQILELGVGGGNNLSHLTGEFQAVAVDLSPQMIEQARKLNPDVEFRTGDMRTVRLGRKFKAVLVHDAISYMSTEDDLLAVFATAAAHLGPGGVFLTAPDWFQESFRDPIVNHGTNSDGATIFTNLEYVYDPDPTDTTIECLSWYLIREGASLRIEEDKHVFGLFSLQVWCELMERSGFAVEKLAIDAQDDPRQGWLLLGVLRA